LDVGTALPAAATANYARLGATSRDARQVCFGQLVSLPVGVRLRSGLQPRGHQSIDPRVRFLELPSLLESGAGVLNLSRQGLVMNELPHRLLAEVRVQAAEQETGVPHLVYGRAQHR